MGFARGGRSAAESSGCLMFGIAMAPLGGDPLARLLAEALSTNPQAAKKLSDRITAIRNRSLGATGKFYRLELRKAIKGQYSGINMEKIVYSRTGGIMDSTMDKYRPGSKRTFPTQKKPVEKGNPIAGKKLAGLMQSLTDDSAGNVTAGLIPKRRGGVRWAERFHLFQIKGSVQIPTRDRKIAGKYMAALGIPIRRGTALTRPRRPIIETVENKNPIGAVFTRLFIERFNRAKAGGA